MRGWLVVATISLTALGLFMPYREQYYAILAVLQSAVSGYLSMRNWNSDPKTTDRDNFLIVGWRNLIARDAALALFLLQIAVITQAVSILLGVD